MFRNTRKSITCRGSSQSVKQIGTVFIITVTCNPAIRNKGQLFVATMPVTQVKPISLGSSTDSTKQKVEDEKSSQSSKWKVFASNTTLHGLRYTVHNGHSIPRRAIWLIFLCASASFYTYSASISIGKFMSRPTKTVRITQGTPKGGLKFPAVTICNLNKFMKSKIDMADDDENFVKMGLNISGCHETRKVRGNLTCGQALLCVYYQYSMVLVNGCNTAMRQNIIKVLTGSSERLLDEEKFLTNYGHDFAGLWYRYCLFAQLQPCSEKDFVRTLTGKFVCYTFNSGYNESGRMFYSTFEGPDLGLSIMLNVQTNESTMSEFSTGFKVIVHEQKTFVNPNSGFNIAPGTHASVALKLKEHERLPAPFGTNCSAKDQLPGLDTYTKDGCIYQCITNLTTNQCGCRMPGFPHVKQLPVCSLQEAACIGRATKDANLTECPCNNACSDLEYESRVSYSKFPHTSVIKVMHHLFGRSISGSYMQENFVYLQVGFQHLSYEKRQDLPSYGPESLFGELGGNMGLLLGCSLLTLFEFIDFLWEVVTSKIRKRSRDEGTEPNNGN